MAGPGRGRSAPGGGLAGRIARRGTSGPLAVVLVLVGLFATGAGLGQATGPLSWPDWSFWSGPDDRDDGDRSPGVLEPSPPIRIRIPALRVRAPVHRVGLADDGSIAVPPLDRHNEAGWYGGGPTPGQYGPAIIVGHVDTRGGPSVFHGLHGLRRGAVIEVTRRDRRVAIFRVTSVEHFDKRRLPAERVYGDYRRPALRLITCGGRWRGANVGYADNVIVFASLAATRRA